MVWPHFAELIERYGKDPASFFKELRHDYATNFVFPVPGVGLFPYARTYHTFEGHIRDGFDSLWELQRFADDPSALVIGWLNHDRRIKPSTSAMLAAGFAKRLGMPPDSVKSVESLVLVTDHFSETPATSDERLMVDCDLAIFGASRAKFIEYDNGIRNEHPFVPRFIFRKKRAAILESFLARPRIYTSGHYDHLEERARENLRWSIDRLRS